MRSKNMVLCTYLVMGLLLYDLYFVKAWPLGLHNHIVEVLMAILRVCIVFAVISLTFSCLSKFQTSRPKGSLAATLQHYNDNAYNFFIRL